MNLPTFPSLRRNGGDIRILLVAALTFLLVLGFYFYTLQPSLAWGDGMKVQLETIKGESFIQSFLPDNLFADDPFPFAKVGVAAWDHPLYVVIGHTLVRLAPNIHSPYMANTIFAVFGTAAIIVLFLLSFAYTQFYTASLLAAGAGRFRSLGCGIGRIPFALGLSRNRTISQITSTRRVLDPAHK
jgi:hypothetical protein